MKDMSLGSLGLAAGGAKAPRFEPPEQAFSLGAGAAGELIAGDLPRRISDVLERTMRQDLGAIGAALSAHGLDVSFSARVRDQLSRLGRVRIGVVDDFGGGSTHGDNVVRRLVNAAPDYLRDHIEVVRFDVSGGRAAGAMSGAAAAVRRGDVVALSLSGGLDAVNLDGLRRDLAPEHEGSPRAFWAALQRFSGRADYERLQRAFMEISLAAKEAPVVTPVWNDGNVTPASLLPNLIVTSLRGRPSETRRTDAPLLVDVHLAPIPMNPFTSQGPPAFIGNSLRLAVSESELRAITGRR